MMRICLAVEVDGSAGPDHTKTNSEGCRMNKIDDMRWRNLESATAQAIDSLMFTENSVFIISALSRLDGVLRSDQPEAARQRAGELQRMLRPPEGFDLGIAAPVAVSERHAWLSAMPREAQRELAEALTSFLRFVSRRGEE